MEDNTIVRVHNTGSTDWSDEFDGKRYDIAADQSQYLPIGALCVWLGNPQDTSTTRQNALERVQMRYGFSSLSVDDWEDVRPSLEVFDQSSGARIWFPSDDPLGKMGTFIQPPSATISDTRDDVIEMRQRLDEMASLMREAGIAQTRADNSRQIGQDGDSISERKQGAIPVDKPTKPRVNA